MSLILHHIGLCQRKIIICFAILWFCCLNHWISCQKVYITILFWQFQKMNWRLLILKMESSFISIIYALFEHRFGSIWNSFGVWALHPMLREYVSGRRCNKANFIMEASEHLMHEYQFFLFYKWVACFSDNVILKFILFTIIKNIYTTSLAIFFFFFR